MAVSMIAVLEEPNGRKFVKRILGDTEAHGRALMAAELKITSGTLLGESIRLDVEPLDAVNGSTSYSDAEFTFRQGTKVSNVHFEQLANGYDEPNSGGFIDITNADIAAFATAWSAARGGGYTLVHARYVK